MLTTALTAAVVGGKAQAQGADWETRLRELENGIEPLWSGFGTVQLAQAGTAIRRFDIPPQALNDALGLFEQQSGVDLTIEAPLDPALQTPGVSGEMPVDQALAQLLAGTGFAHRFTGADTAMLEPAPATTAQAGEPQRLAPLVVEGEAIGAFGDVPEEPGFKADYQTSGTKTPLPIKETPQSITVTTRESIDDRQARDVNSAIELTAGATSGRSGQGGPFAGKGLNTGENFNLRGQELNENRDIRMDGFSIPSSAFDMSIVERVEVVKGAASMLYGQGSLGGFVNIVRKKPKPEPFLALTTQAGSFDTYRAELDVNGAIDPDESFAGRLTTAFEDSGSFIHGVGTQTAVFAPSFEAVIDDDTRALIQVVYQRDEYIPSQGVPLKVDGDKARAPKIPRSWFIGIPSEEESTADNIMATLRLDHQITDRWLASLAIQGAWQNAHRYFDSYGYDFGGLQTDTVNMTSDTAHIENQNWAGELRIDGAFDFLGQEHRLLAGIEKNRRWNRTAFGYTSLGALNIYDGDFDDVPTIPGGAGNQPFDRDSDFVSDNQAVYGQLLIGLTERTRLLAGIRYDDVKQERFDNIEHDETGEKEDDAITLRFGLSQDFTDNITGYALYSQSFNPVEAFSSSGAILDPETGESYEVGVKTDWLDGNLAASLALFQQELDNRPIPDPDDPANFSISGGLERTRGIEFELAGTPYPGVTIGASAAFLDAKVVDKQDDNYGLKPYSSVDRIIGFYASYEFQEGPLEGLGLGTTVVNMGDRSASFAGNAAQFNNGTDELYVPGYTRWDLSLFYNGIEGVDLSFQVRNVLDEVYIERFRDVSGSNYFGSPRAYLFRGHVKF